MSKIPAFSFSYGSGVSDVLRGFEPGFPDYHTGLLVRRGALLIIRGALPVGRSALSAADKLVVVEPDGGDVLFDVFDEAQTVGPVAGGGLQSCAEIQEIAIYIVHKKLSYVLADH